MKISRHSIAFLLAIVLVACLPACDSGGVKNEVLLPPSIGDDDDIRVIVEKDLWDSGVKDAIKGRLEQVQGLLGNEKEFKVYHFLPSQVNTFTRRQKNIIWIINLDNQQGQGGVAAREFNEEALATMQKSDQFSYIQENAYAKDQSVVYLIGKNKEDLLEKLEKNMPQVESYFKKRLNERIQNALQAKGVFPNLKAYTAKHGFSLTLPSTYQVAFDTTNFIWFRDIGKTTSNNIWVYKEPYVSNEIFKKENLLALRERMTKAYTTDPEKSDLYITTQPIFPIDTTTVSWKGRYTVNVEGLWRLSNNTLGGPYEGRVFLDKASQNVFYIEGWVEAPNKKKLSRIKELRSIISTFEEIDTTQ